MLVVESMKVRYDHRDKKGKEGDMNVVTVGEDENGREPKLLPVYPDELLMGHHTPPG